MATLSAAQPSAMAQESGLPTVLCCECGVGIEPNPTSMCLGCLRGRVDVTEGVATSVNVYQCRSCARWLRPPWTHCEPESRELMALCLRKVNGLGNVKLVDTCWVWTEPHSKRLKVKLTVQKEVVHGAVLQQAFVVEFVVRNQQCTDCQRSFAEGSWAALVQLRQRVDHKRTFYYLEQLLLKHGAHEKASGIQALRDGMDFYFETRSHAQHFLQFISSVVPVRTRHARKLVGADLKSNAYNFKYTFYTEIAPACKDDLVWLPRDLAANLGSLARLCLVQKVTNNVIFIDPLSCQRGEVDAEKYWKYKLERSLCTANQLIEYVVLGSEPVMTPRQVHAASAARKKKLSPGKRKRGRDDAAVDDEEAADAPDKDEDRASGSRRRADVAVRSISNRHRLADVTVARSRDLGSNDITFSCRTHLGHLLRAGDTVLGYDVQGATLSDDLDGETLPDVVLVRKLRGHGGRRRWHVKKIDDVAAMEDEEGGMPGPKGRRKRAERQAQQQAELEAQQYETFLQQIEVDADMRTNINLYRNAVAQRDAMETEGASEPSAGPEDEEDIRFDELLDELTLADPDADPDEDDTGAIFASAESAPVASAIAEATERLMKTEASVEDPDL